MVLARNALRTARAVTHTGLLRRVDLCGGQQSGPGLATPFLAFARVQISKMLPRSQNAALRAVQEDWCASFCGFADVDTRQAEGHEAIPQAHACVSTGPIHWEHKKSC
jgi:hypothetical protein